MLLIWEGRGLMVVVALFPLLASCAGLTGIDPKWAVGLGLGVSLWFAGLFCMFVARRWCAPEIRHSFYFIPIHVWGWIFLGLLSIGSGLLFVLSLTRYFGASEPPPKGPNPNDFLPSLIISGVLFPLAIVSIFLIKRFLPAEPTPSSGTIPNSDITQVRSNHIG